LRLRAGLHRAYQLGTSGKAADAEAVLTEIVEGSASAALEDRSVLVLRVLTQARLLLLRAAATEPRALVERFREVFREQVLPPSVVAWQRQWEAELEYRASVSVCARDVACKRRAETARQAAQAEVKASMPVVTAGLAERGVLTLGSLELTIDYHPGTGLVAVVRTDPGLVFLPWPGKGWPAKG